MRDPPKLFQTVKRLINLLLLTTPYHRLHLDWMRAVHHSEHIVPAHESEPGTCTLQIVDRLPHVSLGTEHERRNPVIAILHILRLADLVQPLDHLRVCEARVPQDGATGL